MKTERHRLLPLVKQIALLLLIALISLLFLWWIYLQRNQLVSVLIPFILALALSYFLSPVINFMEEKKISRTVALSVLFTIFLLLVFVFWVRFFPALVIELQELSEQLPLYIEQFQAWLERLQESYRRFNIPPGMRNIIDENLEGFQTLFVTRLEHIYTYLFNTFNSLLLLLLVPVLTFYFLRDEKLLKKWLINTIPSRSRQRFLVVAGEIDADLGAYLRGLTLNSFIVGLTTYLGLLILGVEFALLLGILNGILNFIPFIGPIIGAIPAVLVALLSSPALAVKVAVLIILIQQLESHFLAPWILGRSLKFHPLVIIVALLLGGKLFGFAGLLLSLPVLVVLRTLVKHILTGGNRILH